MHSDGQPWPVSVQWDENWFTASSIPCLSDHGALDCVQIYMTLHRSAPPHIIFYDDGEIHACWIEVQDDSTFV